MTLSIACTFVLTTLQVIGLLAEAEKVPITETELRHVVRVLREEIAAEEDYKAMPQQTTSQATKATR